MGWRERKRGFLKLGFKTKFNQLLRTLGFSWSTPNCLYKHTLQDDTLWPKMKAISQQVRESQILPSLMLPHVQEILGIGPVFLLTLMLIWEILRQSFSESEEHWALLPLLPLKQFVFIHFPVLALMPRPS